LFWDVIGFTPQEAEAFRQLFPYFAPFEIAANTYRGQTSPLASVAVWNFLVANSGLAPEAAYSLTGTLIRHAGEIQNSFAAAASMSLKNLGANTFMPFHSGAARYYRENGVQMAQELASE
jgi:TRAP transporter TAXI family solute receptor